ncbi:MAG: protein kinase [Myxococcota bacterium]|nr:protein kinase [Myxococcota bacterium]
MPELVANRFELNELLGEGGVSRVYRAYDRTVGHEVAIKLLHPRYLGEGRIRRRFMREARAFKRLRHPNIVKMFDFGDADQGPYICLEFVQGQTLSTYCETCSFEDFIRVLDDVLAALTAAHAKGVYHRDVKPDNVLVIDLDGAPCAKLLDFGFARLDDEESEYSKRDAFGTPRYMAPEQISHAAPIGPATDIYSLAVVVYEFLSGQPPFDGSHGMAVALKHLTDPVPNLILRTGMSAGQALIPIVMRALAKAPADRYASVPELRHAIVNALGEEKSFFKQPVTAPGVDAAAAQRIAEMAFQDLSRSETAPIAISHSTVGEHVIVDPIGVRPLIGRDLEQDWLSQALRGVANGRPGELLLVDADPGMGRRQLLGWLTDTAKVQGRVQVVSFGHRRHAGEHCAGIRAILDELLGGLVNQSTAYAELVRRVEKWAALPRSAPLLRYLEPGALTHLVEFVYPEGGDASESADDRLLVEDIVRDAAHTIGNLVALASLNRPVLFTVGDLDRLDSFSNTVLLELVSLLEQHALPILFVVSHSSTGLSKKVDEVIARLRTQTARVQSRSLRALQVDDMRLLLQHVAPLDEAVAEAVAVRTKGNPYFATELVKLLKKRRELDEYGGRLALSENASPAAWPSTLAETLLLRARATLADLPDGQLAEELLQACAVLGEGFEYDVLIRYLTTESEQQGRIERGVELLVENGFLADSEGQSGDRIHFVHRLLWEELNSQISLDDRRLLHSRAADAMSADASMIPHRAVEIAAHLEEAGRKLEAGRYWLRAAMFARRSGDLPRCRHLLERANAVLEASRKPDADYLRAQIWLDLGAVELNLSSPARAKVLAASIIKWSRATDETYFYGRGLLLLGDALRAGKAFGEALRAYGQANDVLLDAADLKGVGYCLLGRGRVERHLGRLGEALTSFSNAAEQFGKIDDRAGQAQMYLAVGELCEQQAEIRPAERAFRRSQKLFEQCHDVSNGLLAELKLGLLLYKSGRREEGRRALARVSAHPLVRTLPGEMVDEVHQHLRSGPA